VSEQRGSAREATPSPRDHPPRKALTVSPFSTAAMRTLAVGELCGVGLDARLRL
jgi:hypothetical protein